MSTLYNELSQIMLIMILVTRLQYLQKIIKNNPNVLQLLKMKNFTL